jgi:glutamate-ammonia-ligase adenylyltransferase
MLAVEGHNIKLGRGGIREIEFFVQTQQLIAGGRNAALRVRDTLGGLDLLVSGGWVTADLRDKLVAAYEFLRGVEHRLQMIADEQTHTLPATEQATEFFARFLGFKSRAAFASVLTAHLSIVEAAYALLFEKLPPLSSAKGGLDLITDPPKSSTLALLGDLGFKEPKAAVATVQSWQKLVRGGLRAREGRDRAAELAPALLEALGRTGDADHGLIAFDRLVTRHKQPIELLTLLRAHPGLLELLAQVLGLAPRLADLISRRAHVFDALLEPAFFGDSPSETILSDALGRSLALARDAEDVLDRVRIFGQEQLFLAGVRVLAGTLSADVAGQAFARLADVIVRRLHRWTETTITAAHGRMPAMRTAVVALGKLGGREMTAGSDLDLLLLYDHDPELTTSDGPRPLTGAHYFSRYTQRLISALTAPTSEGMLYEADLRLRPSGRSGPVATHIDGFVDYHRTESWTWEHMALTRARVVSASDGFSTRIDAAIRGILTQKRDRAQTIADVVDMRRAIADDKGDDDRWNLKYARGGLVDLEFIAQATQLIHAANSPSILDTNTARVIENAATLELIDKADVDVLRRAYRLQHDLTQILRLCLVDRFDAKTARPALKQLLARAGELPDFATLDADLIEAQRAVRKVFEKRLGKL